MVASRDVHPTAARLRQPIVAITATVMRTFFALMVAGSVACAQQWPSKPVRLVIPYEPGGLADRLGRMMAEKITPELGQRVVAENRAGSAGLIAAALVAKAPADGYTLMVGGSGPHVTGPATNSNAGYDPIKDFTHIAMIGGDVFLLVAHPSHGWKSLRDMETAAKAGTRLSFGSTGIATPTHLVVESYIARSKIPMTHVPYKGGGPAIVATLGNHTPLVLVTLSSLAPHVESGALVPIALSSARRHAAFPSIATFAEQGYPEVDGGTLFWLSGPARLPAAITERLNREIRKALQAPDVKAAFDKQLLTTSDDDVARFQAFVAQHVSSWTGLIKSLDLKIE